MTQFSEIEELDAEHGMQTYGRLPVAFVRGEGVKLWDSEGKEYLDFLGGLAVTALGHAHPAVADALADQARTLLHVSNLYFNEWQPQVAARLDALHGGGGKVFFSNSGAEANECAIKLARRYGQANGGPDRFHVLSAWGSFHGRTLTTLAATGQPQKQETFQPLPSGFRQVSFADVDALAAAMDERVCAVLLELPASSTTTAISRFVVLVPEVAKVTDLIAAAYAASVSLPVKVSTPPAKTPTMLAVSTNVSVSSPA